ncbi:interferon-induced protein with tetratricopeptide repeats 5-like isoform X3 [Scyliorhinus canicula]|uniref:interferon-induced protein with tetratricopeptide repeats 5-like isoform X3 n=1 Tax=Scyliorhinus canicula TaxID=7830 RepID=UPI0018F5C592|nr:interferon-induced protein with tetratricopeptide repeats 5-like isoform X3 [Scyliorhinus canicula]
MNNTQDLLKVKLDQLQCHFTWAPQRENIDLDDMKQKLQDSIDLNMKYKARSYNHLAFVNCLQGNCEKAIQNLKEAEKILRKNHEDEFDKRIIITYGNYAWVYYHMGQLTEAQSYLDKLERICKQFPDASRYTAMIPEVYGEKGWTLLNSGVQCYKEAMDCFETALEEDPNNTDWNIGYAIVLSRLEGLSGATESVDSSQSLRQWRRVLKLDPNDTEAMVQLALKLQEFNQYEEADRLVKQALEKSPGLPYVLRYAAKFYRKARNIEKALELLDKALKMSPNSAFLYHQKGVCYKNKMKTLKKSQGSKDSGKIAKLINDCKDCFTKAFKLKPSFIIAKLDYANICSINGEYCEAEKIYSELLELENTCPENKQDIRLQVGLFEQYYKDSKSNGIKYFLEGFKIKHDSYARNNCRINLEKIAENSQDIVAFCIRGIIHMLDGEECFEKILEIECGKIVTCSR